MNFGSFLEVLADILDSFAGTISRNEVFMITRKSFFIRWLLFRDEKEEQKEKSVIDIEHIQSGNSQRVSNLEEASLWMQEVQAEREKVQEIEAE